jgi:hypothetical protein
MVSLRLNLFKYDPKRFRILSYWDAFLQILPIYEHKNLTDNLYQYQDVLQ